MTSGSPPSTSAFFLEGCGESRTQNTNPAGSSLPQLSLPLHLAFYHQQIRVASSKHTHRSLWQWRRILPELERCWRQGQWQWQRIWPELERCWMQRQQISLEWVRRCLRSACEGSFFQEMPASRCCDEDSIDEDSIDEDSETQEFHGPFAFVYCSQSRPCTSLYRRRRQLRSFVLRCEAARHTTCTCTSGVARLQDTCSRCQGSSVQ